MERKIRELTQNNCLKFQVAAPCIPGVKIYSIVDDLPNLYRLVINSMTEMICIGTGDC